MNIYGRIKKAKTQKGANRPILSLLMAEICIDGRPVKDDVAIKILDSMRKNSITTYGHCIDNGKLNEAHQERLYCETIMKFIPRPITLEEIHKIIDVLEIPREIKSMSFLMKTCKELHAIVDGKMVKTALLG